MQRKPRIAQQQRNKEISARLKSEAFTRWCLEKIVYADTQRWKGYLMLGESGKSSIEMEGLLRVRGVEGSGF